MASLISEYGGQLGRSINEGLVDDIGCNNHNIQAPIALSPVIIEHSGTVFSIANALHSNTTSVLLKVIYFRISYACIE